MEIHRLTVLNFRGWEQASFMLDPHFNVAIGNNGAGKSTLLHAMQIAAGAFFMGLPSVSRRHIHEDEIRVELNPGTRYFDQKTPTMVEAEGHINGSGMITWRRVLSSTQSGTSHKERDIGSIKRIAEEYAALSTQTERPKLPLIAYYGVRHLGSRVGYRQSRRSTRGIIKDGYYNALGEKSDEARFVEWFYNYDEGLARGTEFAGTREAVFQAISTAIPYLSNICFNRHYLQLEADCDFEGGRPVTLLHSLMSDGMKRMLGIVTDIAYRCATLNGFLGEYAVQETAGIVLIDELDMHLHPNWQRMVVSNLRAAFPNIQFIATTHSAFLLQSLQSHQVISLGYGAVRGQSNPVDQTLHKVAQDWMHVENPRSDDFESRFLLAESAFRNLQDSGHPLTMDAFAEVQKLIAGILPSETDDPVYKAFLLAQANA